MTDIPGTPGAGSNINKQGGDAGAVSYSGSYADGAAFQDGSYAGGGEGSASAGLVGGAGSVASAGDVFAGGGHGGVDQTTIGDITINT